MEDCENVVTIEGAKSIDQIVGTTVLGAIGFGCMEYFVVNIPTQILTFSSPSYSMTPQGCLWQFSFLGGFVIMFICACFARRSIFKHQVVFCCFQLLLLLSILYGGLEASGIIDVYGVLHGLIVALQAAGSVSMIMLWLSLFFTFREWSVPVVLGIGFVLAALLYAGVSFQESAAYVPYLEEVAICVVAILVGAHFARKSTATEVQRAAIDGWSSSKILRPKLMSELANGAPIYLSMGYCAVFACSQGADVIKLVVLAGCMAAAALCVAVLIHRSMEITLVRRMTLPITGCALLALPFVQDMLQGALCAFVSMASMTIAVTNWLSAAEDAREFNLSSAFRFSVTMATLWASFLIGTSVGVICATDAFSAMPECVAVVTGMLLVSTCICWLASKKVDSELYEIALGSNQLEGVGFGDGYQDTFMHACHMIEEGSELTSRECAIFELLAKGRNAKVIQQKLYISESTVRTHMVNIYHKLKINSHQELIDLVEEEIDEMRPEGVITEDAVLSR